MNSSKSADDKRREAVEKAVRVGLQDFHECNASPETLIRQAFDAGAAHADSGELADTVRDLQRKLGITQQALAEVRAWGMDLLSKDAQTASFGLALIGKLDRIEGGSDD